MAKVDAKAKAKRQKIIVAVLGVVLVAVLAYQVPSLMKTKKPPAAAAPAPAPATAPVPLPAVGGPLAGMPAVSAPSSATLVDSDPAAQPAEGQLVSFDRFSTKDPFVQPAGTQVCDTDPTGQEAPVCSTTKPVAPKPTPPKSTTPKPATPPTTNQPAAVPTLAEIKVNGTTEQVNVGATFPVADPVFRLVSLTKTTAKVGIAGGSLSTGGATVTITKGKKVTLMNTADGTRYELVLVSLS